MGAAFGWSAEALKSMGVGVVCTEISSYVLDSQLISEEAELREIITTAGLDPDGWMQGPGRTSNMSAPWELAPHSDGSGKLRWRARYMDAMLRENRGLIGVRTSVEVIGEDSSTADSRTTLKSLKPSYSHIVTEFVIPSLTDDEVLTFCKNMEDLRVSLGLSEVHHMFNHSPKDTEIFSGHPEYEGLPGLNPKLNNKSAAQWRSFLDAAGFISHRLVSSSANEYKVT